MTIHPPRPSLLASLAGGLVLCLPLSPRLLAGAAEPVTVTGRVEGRTPLIIGINTGEMPEGSAFPEWIQALGVNGARLRLSARPPEPGADAPSTETAFLKRARELRSGAAKETPGIWQYPENISASSLDALRREGIELLATITTPFSFHLLSPGGQTDWARAWEFWKAYYAQAYQLALRHQVCRYQLFNEPDHKASMKLSQEEYSARLRIGTDAIQAALADASRDSGKTLPPLISAPCTASIKAFLSRGLPDTRDPLVGWGELTMRDRHVRLDGRNDPAWSQIQQYAYQQYSINPTNFLGQLDELRTQVTAANGGKAFPIVMTEFNVHTAASFSKLETTLDSPREFSGLGAMSTALAASGLEEMYFFRLTLSWDQENNRVKKNGIHHVNEDENPPEITGTTRAAEVVRLAAGALTGGHDLLGVTGGDGICTAATRTRGRLDLLLANTNSEAVEGLQVVLPGAEGTVLNTFECVSGDHFGSVRILEPEGNIRLSLPAQSFGTLCSREVSSLTPAAIHPAGSFSTVPGKLLTGGKDSSRTLLVFPAVEGKDPLVFLRLKSRSRSEKPVPIHLYASQGALPSLAELEAGHLPFERKTPPPEGRPGLTVEGLGKGLQLARGFSIDPGASETWIDISRAVRRLEPGKNFSLLLSRDVRQAGESIEAEPVEWNSAELAVYSLH